MAHWLIAGGGLSGVLTAWFRLSAQPHDTAAIYDCAAIGGDHTWSFNLSDLTPTALQQLAPFIKHQWPGYEVAFPGLRRSLDIPYASGDSASLLAAVAPLVSAGRLSLHPHSPVERITSDTLELTTGPVRGDVVLDARGGMPGRTRLGFQKFVGQVVRTAHPHGLQRPRLMDATVPQVDGYRFFYCLPYSERELLIEDTRYADGPQLHRADLAEAIAAYARDSGWQIEAVLHTEQGVLPIALAVARDNPPEEEQFSIGLRGGLFHAVTGYSLPVAAALAERLAALPTAHPAQVASAVTQFKTAHRRRERLLRLLNRMLFAAAPGPERYRVLARFYGLPEPLIKRFYAGHLSNGDALRLLVGKPPVRVTRALRVLSERRFYQCHPAPTPPMDHL